MLGLISVAMAFLASLVSGAPIAGNTCNAQRRIAISSQVPYAYAQPTFQQTYQAFSAIPFGVPDLQGIAVTTIYPNGASGVTVSNTGQGVVNFGTETRQAFSEVTAQYTDLGTNGTTVIYTNVTLGVQSEVEIPVTFTAQVYLDFNNDCRIYGVRAFAQIPTYINGKPTDLSEHLPLPKTPITIT